MRGGGGYGNSVLSSQLFCEPKTALKNKVYIKQTRKRVIKEVLQEKEAVEGQVPSGGGATGAAWSWAEGSAGASE